MEALNKLLDSLSPNTNAELPEAPQEASGGLLNKLWDKLSPSKEPPQYSRDTGVKPLSGGIDELFKRVISAESGGKHYDEKGGLLTSPAGAQGITQLMPDTARNPGFGIQGVQNASESEYKRVGREYLGALMSRYNGDKEKALAAYNAGLGWVDKAIEKGGRNWKDYLPKKEETLPYLKKILGD